MNMQYMQARPQQSWEDQYDEAIFLEKLRKELARHTKLKCSPSEKIAAYRAYEQAFFLADARPYGCDKHPVDSRMAYNISDDAARLTQTAIGWLTDDGKRSMTGFTKTTIPRRALDLVAKAIGFRYMRGLVAIEGRLKPTPLAQFRSQRKVLMKQFCQAADVAHADNDKGQNPQAALAAINLFVQELLALCPWFEITGHQSEAAALHEKVQALKLA